MQIFTVNFTRFVCPLVTNLLDLWYFFRKYLCPTYFSYVEKKDQNKDSFNNDRYDRIYWASSFLKR